MKRNSFFIVTFLFLFIPIIMSIYIYSTSPNSYNSSIASLGFVAPAFHPNHPFLRYTDQTNIPNTPHPGWGMWQKGTYVQTNRLP